MTEARASPKRALCLSLWRSLAYHLHVDPINVHTSCRYALLGSRNNLRPDAITCEGEKELQPGANSHLTFTHKRMHIHKAASTVTYH